MESNHLSRRHFLKSTASVAVAATTLAGLSPQLKAQNISGIALVTDPSDSTANLPPPQWALSELKKQLEAKGQVVVQVSKWSEVPQGYSIIVIAGGSSTLASQIGVSVPSAPESLALTPGNLGGKDLLGVFGSDSRGLMYAILELVDRIHYSETVVTGLTLSKAITEQTYTKIRSIVKHFANTTEDLPNFRDKKYWDEYLTMLAHCRYNRFAWGSGQNHNYSLSESFWIPDAYFCFMYPYFVSTGGVTVSNVSAEDQKTNLEMLKYISDGCALRGLDFTLQVWNSNFKVTSAKYNIQGLSGDLGGPAHESYSRDALGLILEACPNITGLTYRSHYEGGIPETNARYWETLFSAVTRFVNKGRKIEIDLHGKNVAEFHLNAVLKSGATAMISPKKTAEQSGLPYHHASIRSMDRNPIPNPPTKLEIPGSSRYGYWSLLQEERRWKVLHRLWPGTQKHLLWGDPAFAAGFGRAAFFCGSDGIETYEQLSFHGRGGEGELGDKNSYADTTLKTTGPEYTKFLITYRIWGRCLYNPNTDPEGWRRIYRKNFAGAASSLEEALANASRILFMVSSIQAASASWIDFWPEVFEGLNITDGMPAHVDSLNPQRITSPFDPQLFATVEEYVTVLLGGGGNELDKYTPLEVASWWEKFSDAALSKLASAKASVPNAQDPEFRRFEADITILANLGLHFAKKWRTAILYSIYRQTNDENAKTEALTMYASALDYWNKVVQAGSVYKKLHYNLNPAHWSDRVAFLTADFNAMKAKVFNTITSITTHPGPAPLAIQTAKGNPVRPLAEASHNPPSTFTKSVALNISLGTSTTTESARLYYRHVYQGDTWNVLEMNKSGSIFSATIPASYTNSSFPLQYYFSLKKGERSRVLFPGLQEDLSNQPYFHVRSVGGEPVLNQLWGRQRKAHLQFLKVKTQLHQVEIQYQLTRPGVVNAKIYNLQGQEISSYTSALQASGKNRVLLQMSISVLRGSKYVLQLSTEGANISRMLVF